MLGFIFLPKKFEPLIEFSTPTWNPWLQQDQEVRENVQKRAVTKDYTAIIMKQIEITANAQSEGQADSV